MRAYVYVCSMGRQSGVKGQKNVFEGLELKTVQKQHGLRGVFVVNAAPYN